eukprot:10977091-Heterocapsa_arctica.AAC.1
MRSARSAFDRRLRLGWSGLLGRVRTGNLRVNSRHGTGLESEQRWPEGSKRRSSRTNMPSRSSKGNSECQKYRGSAYL